MKLQGQGKDLSCLLVAPHILHARPLSQPIGSRLTLDINGERVKVDFMGFSKAPNGDITVGFRHSGQDITAKISDPNASVVTAKSGPRKADPTNLFEYGTVVPGEILSYTVQVGDLLKEG